MDVSAKMDGDGFFIIQPGLFRFQPIKFNLLRKYYRNFAYSRGSPSQTRICSHCQFYIGTINRDSFGRKDSTFGVLSEL